MATWLRFSGPKTTKAPRSGKTARLVRKNWLRGLDLNQRPSGYEPDELPDCSTPRHLYVTSGDGLAEPLRRRSARHQRPKAKDAKMASPGRGGPLTCKWVFYRAPPAAMPGDDLLSQRLSASTI